MNFSRNDRQYDTHTIQIQRKAVDDPSYYYNARSPKIATSRIDTDDTDRNTIILENVNFSRSPMRSPMRSPLRSSSRGVEKRTIFPVEEKAYMMETEPGSISNLTIAMPLRDTTRTAQGSPKQINLQSDYYDFNTRTYVPGSRMNEYNDVLLSKKPSRTEFKDSLERYGTPERTVNHDREGERGRSPIRNYDNSQRFIAAIRSPERTAKPSGDLQQMRSPVRDYENSRKFIESMRSPGRNKEMVYVEEKRYYIQDELAQDDAMFLVLKNAIIHIENNSSFKLLGRYFRKWRKIETNAIILELEAELKKKPKEVVKEIFQEVIKEVEVVRKQIVQVDVIQQVPIIQTKIQYVQKSLANLDVIRPVAAESILKAIMKQRLFSIRSRLNRLPKKNIKEIVLRKIVKYAKGYDAVKMSYFNRWKECSLKMNQNVNKFKKSVLRTTKSFDKKKLNSIFNKWRRLIGDSKTMTNYSQGFDCFQRFVKARAYRRIMPIQSCFGLKKRVIVKMLDCDTRFRTATLKKAIKKWKLYMTWVASSLFKLSILKNLKKSLVTRLKSKRLVKYFTKWRRVTQTMRQYDQLNQAELKMKKMAYKRLEMQIRSINRRYTKESLMKYFNIWKLVTVKSVSVTKFQGFLDLKSIIKKNLVSYAWEVMNYNSRKSRIQRILPKVLRSFDQRLNIVRICWALSKWLRYISFHRQRFQAVVKLVKVMHLRRLIISAEYMNAAFIMKKLQNFSKLVLLRSGFDMIKTGSNRQKTQVKIFAMMRKNLIGNIAFILKRSYRTMRTAELIGMCFKHKDIAKKRYRKELIKRWRFITHINNIAKKKMELMYTKIQDTYMSMASELIENEQEALLNEFENNTDETLDFKDLLKKTSGTELRKKVLFDLETGIVSCENDEKKNKN
jgi:hypothetical protein